MGTLDPNQPSMRAMSLVKIRNNVTDRALRRTLGQFEMERSAAILVIDHDRLDMRDFLKTVKHCRSDDLPEAKHWLRDGIHFPIKTRKKTRLVQLAPSGEETKDKNGQGGNDIDPYSDEWQNMGAFGKTKFALAGNMRRSSILHMDIYSRRNMLSSIDREIIRPTEPEKKTQGGINSLKVSISDHVTEEVTRLSPVNESPKEQTEGDGDKSTVKFCDSKSDGDDSEVFAKVEEANDPGQETIKPEKSHRQRVTTPIRRVQLPPATAPHNRTKESTIKDNAKEDKIGEDTREDRLPHGKADILVIERDGLKTPRALEISRAEESVSRERPKTQGAEASGSGGVNFPGKRVDGFHHKTPKSASDKDFMKDLLVKNAKKRYRKKKKVPIEDRLKTFYEKMDVIREKEEKEAAGPISIENQRRWVLLTKGVDAALAQSSEEEDNNLNTA